jgi:arginase
VAGEWVCPVDATAPEMARLFELNRRPVAAVAAGRENGRFPLVLAGNCISCLGTVAGCRGAGRLGVVWLDAHADFDTPDDNLSGFSDVMGLSILTGGSWHALRATIPGLSPVEEGNVITVGTRDLESYQRTRLLDSGITVVADEVDETQLGAALRGLSARVDAVYLHVDLDVLDTSVGRANAYAADGGPDLSTVLRTIRQTFRSAPVVAAALTAYDPESDRDGGILGAARAIAGEIAQGVAGASASPEAS